MVQNSAGAAIYPFDFCDTGKRAVPARLQFAGDQPVCGIGGVILTEGAIGRVACGFEIAHQSVADLITALASLGVGRNSRRNRTGLDDLQQRCLDGVVDPQAAKGDAPRLAIVRPATGTRRRYSERLLNGEGLRFSLWVWQPGLDSVCVGRRRLSGM
jgi:hypothetical protein